LLSGGTEVLSRRGGAPGRVGWLESRLIRAVSRDGMRNTSRGGGRKGSRDDKLVSRMGRVGSTRARGDIVSAGVERRGMGAGDVPDCGRPGYDGVP
jgi:hypothetical protein